MNQIEMYGFKPQIVFDRNQNIQVERQSKKGIRINAIRSLFTCIILFDKSTVNIDFTKNFT